MNFIGGESHHDCGPSLKRCNNGECTQIPFACPEDEGSRDQPADPDDDYFLCEVTGERVPVAFYCDFVVHCTDRSDESSCDYPACGPDEFRCDNGQCIEANKVCDLIPNCLDDSDEKQCAEICNGGFQCFDGTCLPDSAVCDGMKSCAGTRWEDEEADCSHQCDSQSQLRCNNGACANMTSTCIYDVDNYGLVIGCRDVTHLRFCETFSCPDWTLKCPSSYCIPLRMRCDGKFDCPSGEDELHCDEFQCAGAYRCNGGKNCVSLDKICDGVPQCPHKDDEAYCDVSCPRGCQCSGFSVKCENVEWTPALIELLPEQARLIQLRSLLHTTARTKRDVHNATTSDAILDFRPQNFPLLANLDLSDNGITEIPVGLFVNSTNLLRLTLADNAIEHLELGTFRGLHRLIYLDLTGNPIARIEAGSFMDLTSLPTLELTYLPIRNLIEGTFHGLDNLRYLSLVGSTVEDVEMEAFVGLGNLAVLHSDMYLFCCLVGEVDECTPTPDQFSSCQDLMRNNILRISIWILGISALLGNALVLTLRLKSTWKEKIRVQGFLILNLAMSDFLMGVYMVIIGSADLRYRDIYIFHNAEWKRSPLCQAAGLLSVLSSQVSVLMLVVISLDRFWCVTFPLKKARLGVRTAKAVAVIAWVGMLAVSLIPVLGIEYFGPSFYGRTGVCLALPLTQDRESGWEFSIAVFIFFNIVCFIVIIISYAGIYAIVRKSSRRIRSSKKSQEVRLASRMLMILCTDFLCWMPVIIMGILSLAGLLSIPSEVYAWTAVFILPLNSALNPYLYTISTLQLRKRKVGSNGTGHSAEGAIVASTCRHFLLSEVKRGQQTLFIEEEQLNKLESELQESVTALHRRGFTHGDITQARVLLFQFYGSPETKWTAELLVPRISVVSTLPTEGANTIQTAIQKDEKQLTTVIAALRRKLGKSDQ